MPAVDNEIIHKQLNWRYACKKFDPTKVIREQDWNILTESLRLSASSYGLQPWKFIVVQNPELRQKLQDASYGQTPVTQASHFVVLTYKEQLDEAHIDKFVAETAKSRGVDPSALGKFRDMMVGDLLKGPRFETIKWWAQRQTYIAQLNQWSDWVLNKVQVDGRTWGTRISDSDETVGHYFGLALVDLVTAPDNPRAGTLLNATWAESHTNNPNLPVGGLDATASDLKSSMRNAIKYYTELAAGGQWIESSAYNLGTPRLLLSGAEAVRTATGVDHFPEITALTKQLALGQMQENTPDLSQAYQWGDVEQAREPELFHRVMMLGIYSGLTQDDPEVGPYMKQFTEDYLAKHGLGYQTIGSPASLEPQLPFFIFFNPYAENKDWKTKLKVSHFASGQNVLFHHDGRDAADSLFGAHFPKSPRVDHGVPYFGDFQLWRKGEWALTHPIGYQTMTGEYTNTMLIGGLSAAYESKDVVAQESTDEYSYIAGSLGGQYYRQPYWEPPATFLHEWTRSLFYLPSKNKKSDTIVVYDRTLAEDPKTLSGYSDKHTGCPNKDAHCPAGWSSNRYYAGEWLSIHNAATRKQWIIHLPEPPVKSANAFTWKTPGNQNVQLTTLLPQQFHETQYDEKQLWANQRIPVAEEKKYQLRIAPQNDEDWNTFLNVIQVHDNIPLENTLITSVDGSVEGTLIRREGEHDAALFFGAKPGVKLAKEPFGDKLDTIAHSRIISTNFSVSLTSSSQQTDLYFADLDTGKNWTLYDNTISVPVTVSSQGLGKATLQTAGNHLIELRTDGTVPAPKAAVQITKMVDKATANTGEILTYTLEYTNTGKTAATNLIITDAIPSGTTYVADSATGASPCFDAVSSELIWKIAVIAPGDKGSVTFSVSVGNKQTTYPPAC